MPTIGAQTTGWSGLGPISVWPEKQRIGIGSALVRDGLARLNARGANGCGLTGDPAFYGRFGFANGGSLTNRDTPKRNVLSLSFNGAPASGEMRFSPAFEG